VIEGASSEVAPAPATLAIRYRPEHVGVFTEAERKRFLAPFGTEADLALDGDEEAWDRIAPYLAWELLYRIEPHLYERLIAGEQIDPNVTEWLPHHAERAVEVAAGTGRLTFPLAERCTSLIAVEPAAGLRGLLEHKLERHGITHVDVRDGFFDAIPVEEDWAELVVSCSAFTSDPAHGGTEGIRELQRIAQVGGLIVLVWPADVEWLEAHGFMHVTFTDEMTVEFSSVDEAIELARIFYPHAVDEIRRRADRRVPYDVLGMNPPRDLAWKRAE
jgi:methyltransferase family protein